MRNKIYRQFNLILLPLIAIHLLAIALFNLVIDPYGILSSASDIDKPNLEGTKPSALPKAVQTPLSRNKTQMTLAQRSIHRAKRFNLNLARLSITRINPKTVLLGTSTVLRLPANHPSLTKLPVYNLGLPGAKMHDVRSYFVDIISTHPDVQQVVIGIDFYSFGKAENTIKTQTKIPSVNPIIAENQMNPRTEIRKNKYSISLPDLVKITFSLDTLNTSFNKIMQASTQTKESIASEKPSKLGIDKVSQSSSLHQPIDSGVKQESKSQANPLLKKNAKDLVKQPLKSVTNQSVKRPLKKIINLSVKQPIDQTNNNRVFQEFIPYRNNKRLDDFRRLITLYWNEKAFYKNYHLSEEELNDFKEIIDLCKKRNITIKVFFSPVHAAHLEAIQSAGLWSSFEEWKRQVIKITPAWDFSDYSSITTEPIDNNMENFVDSVHYDPQIGNLILNRLNNYHKERVPTNFGILLTPANIESHLGKIRVQRKAWLKTHQATVKFVQDLKKQTNLKSVDGRK